MKKVIIWIIIVIVIGSTLFYFLKPKDSAIEYITVKVEKTDIVQTVSVTGGVTPVNKANLSFEGSGTVDKIYVDVGDVVKKGDKIIGIDDSIMRSQLSEAYLELERQQEILKQVRRNGWNDLSPDEKAAAKLVEEKARASVWTIQKKIKKTTLYAPIDGVVVKRYIDVGELATSPVIMIMGEGGFEIKAEVPESDISKIKVGQKAEVTFDAFSSDEVFEVEVSKIEPAATVIQDVVYYEVTFNILTKDTRFKAGMSADIDIATADKNGVLAVTGQAIKNDSGKKYVEVIVMDGNSSKNKTGNKTTRSVDVKTGLRGDDGIVEIISGLTEGEEVVTFTKEK